MQQESKRARPRLQRTDADGGLTREGPSSLTLALFLSVSVTLSLQSAGPFRPSVCSSFVCPSDVPGSGKGCWYEYDMRGRTRERLERRGEERSLYIEGTSLTPPFETDRARQRHKR